MTKTYFVFCYSVIAVVTDTEPANTGEINGTITLLDNKLIISTAIFTCRHHTSETLIANALKTALDKGNTGPVVKILFEVQNKDIAITLFKSGKVENLPFLTEDERSETIKYLKSIKNFIRRDHQEMVTVIRHLLNDTSCEESLKPITIQNLSRWMHVVTNIGKIYIFQSQITSLTEKEKEEIAIFLVFAIRIYIRPWFDAEKPFKAARHDLQILKNLKLFRNVDENMANQVIKCYLDQLWYLNPKIVGLCLFDDEISVAEKNEIRLKILSVG